ncbi:DNA-binding CsgD family transcriptional regulator [Pelomonas saccharophila]|uniref:DNA-binding CsgD family transcriptional regulator n=1 Tax=Roseateles saccharophilus TaxID=304 RepID=A0ABU1YKI8_ROSSA|nr:helix-turn-helix transcriptional regulator [Roseateles saccharophilus]MDR7269379.1 DNA-binding CsgD family transcriptional regulator [Roseateles saccharophilus]
MRPKKSRELSRLRELCALDLPTPLVMPTLLAELHAFVPSSRNLFDWCDGNGALARYCVEGSVDERVAKLYFDEFHNKREAEAMPSFAQALASGAVLNSAAQLDTGRFLGSALYAEIWRPQGFRYRVELIVRSREGRPLGSLVLYRGPGEPCFTAAEEARLLPLLPYLAQALSRDTLPRCAPERWQPAPEAAEVLLLDEAGRLGHASAGARRLLLQAGPGPGPQPAQPSTEALLAGLHAAAQGGPVTQWVDSPWGRFELNAQRLDAVDPATPCWTQVQLRRLEPSELADERRLQGFELSSGQATVARLLMQGLAQAQVAQRLGVAPSTVVDHTRKLYQRLGVRSARELLDKLRSAPN